ncbi:DUF998 domain-containing protein [Romboutsia maritimum]|uniref:DUF998 domain-containing protein n=1 Tax=Romboutsia maritimum TaxID=2020948 RepID=A0A371IR63_9FIRM|nr:DUF998 domain-containing protein [Romboutsia maritimum]RDY22971.1 DUF998 domain-containing protein [Romboutsia maritimum]
MSFWGSKLSWILLIIAIVGDVIVPYILGLFYPNYSQIRDVMSILGNPNSPVKSYYNAWLMIVGTLLLISAFNLYKNYNRVYKLFSLVVFILVSTFAIGDCIISSIFSTYSQIHSIGSGIGFTALALVSLIISAIYFRDSNFIGSIMCIVLFILSLVLFILFLVPSSLIGLWQRLLLVVIYLPLLNEGVNNIKK